MEILTITGKIGDSIVVSGNGMTYVNKVFFFDNAPATFRSLSDQYLYVTVPEEACHGPVQVVSDFLELSGYSNSSFIPLPRILTLNPTSGLFFDTIALSGFCLGGVTGVKLGELDCAFSISGNNLINFTIPPGSSKNRVKLETYSGLSSLSSIDFDVVPVITGFEYGDLFPGLPLLIKGRYFDEHLLNRFDEIAEYKVDLINSGQGLKYFTHIKGGKPTKDFSLNLLKGSTYIFDFSGIASGDHFYFTKNAELSGEFFNLASIDAEASGFDGVISKGENLYLIPQKFSKVVKVNSSGSFDSGKFELLDLGVIGAELKEFKGGFSFNNSGYLIPHINGKLVRFGLGGEFNSGTIGVLDLAALNPGLSGFNGGFVDGNYGYLAPHINGKFTRVDLPAFISSGSGLVGVKYLDLTLIDSELTGFAGAFKGFNSIILVPNKNSKLVSIELEAIDNPSLFSNSGIKIYNLDQYNYCDLVTTGFFYTANNILDMNGSGMGYPTGLDTGFIEANISKHFDWHLFRGSCGGPRSYLDEQYKINEAVYTSEFSRIDLPSFKLIMSGNTSGMAESGFATNSSFGFSGDQTLKSGELSFVTRPSRMLDKLTYFVTGLDTGIHAFSSGWLTSGSFREVYEIPFCVLIVSGKTREAAETTFSDRFGSGYCGNYLLTGHERIYTGLCDLYVSGSFGESVSQLFSGYISSGACSSDGYNFTFGNYVSGTDFDILASYDLVFQTGAFSGIAYSGHISGFSGIRYLDGFTRIRTDNSFYGTANKQSFFASSVTTGRFELVVSGSSFSGASNLFDSYLNSGIAINYRGFALNDLAPKYSPIGVVVEKDTFLVNATQDEDISYYGFSGVGYISTGAIISKAFPYIFESGWITSGMVTRGEDFYHKISGRVQKNIRDNLENFIGGFSFGNSGYLLPGAIGSGYAQIFAFNLEDFDANLNIDLTGSFTGNYNGGFQAADNGHFISKNSSKVFKFENEYFDFNNLSSVDTRNVLKIFNTCKLVITGSTTGEVELILQNYLNSGYCGSGNFTTTGNYASGSVYSVNSFTNFVESGVVYSGICSLAVRATGFILAEDLFHEKVASGACGNFIDGYTFENYNSGYNLCSGEERFLQSTFFESGASGSFVSSGDIAAFGGYVIFNSGVRLSAEILPIDDVLGFSAGAILGDYIYGVPHQNGVLARYKNTFEPYLSGYSISGNGTQLKVIFKPQEQLTGLVYFSSGNVEYNDSGVFNVVKSNQFLVQFFGSAGDEYFERLDEFTLSGIIPTGALSGSVLIVRPDEADGITRYY